MFSKHLQYFVHTFTKLLNRHSQWLNSGECREWHSSSILDGEMPFPSVRDCCGWMRGTLKGTVTATRNTLAIDILSSLMFLSECGPLTSEFKPQQYVKSWPCNHVCADDTKARALSVE